MSEDKSRVEYEECESGNKITTIYRFDGSIYKVITEYVNGITEIEKFSEFIKR